MTLLLPGERETTVLNFDPDVDIKHQPMFFGTRLGLARFDQVRYPVFEKLTREMKSKFWSEEEINLSQDKIDYWEKLQPNQRRIFEKNIAYQTVMDSVTSRAVMEAFLPWASLPELEECIKTWSFFEAIHNRAYQWIEQNLHLDPSVHFDTILRDEGIMNRARTIVSYYDDFIRYSNRVKVFGYGRHLAESSTLNLTAFEHKRLAYRAMLSVYALESIRFYVSFACTFALAQQGLMTGNAKEIKLIARDEALHVGISLAIIRNWPKDDPDFDLIAYEEKNWVILLFKEVVAQEAAWAEHLFSEGPMLGLNHDLMVKYLEHLANKRLKNIGLDHVFANKSNPFKWMNNWIVTEDEQVAPQETEVTTYKVSALGSAVDDKNLVTDF
jgi:ribonucleoside-diphosphate reductase beta chain